ncbi:MAG: signal peptidase I [Bdellovibrionota bacterium]
MVTESKKATAMGSLGLFALALFIFLSLRWAVLEPFIIPSGSMIPSLLIHDHIGVAKWSFGLRVPFSQKWLTGPYTPERFDVVVFKSVENPDMYMIKRVIGLPGDHIQITKQGGLVINDIEIPRKKLEEFTRPEEDLEISPDQLDFYLEGEKKEHVVMQRRAAFRWEVQAYDVPEGKLLMMGDNRDASHDGRYWGYLPLENLVGKALFIWLSCTETISVTQNLCDPNFIRWQRIFSPIQ